MTANEIRNMSVHHFGKVTFLQEIAAQLADLNEGIRLLTPAPKTDVPEPYEPSDQDKHEDALTAEANAIHAANWAKPVSDPEKFARCSWCTKEIPIPKEGQALICDDCIPF